MSAARVRIVSFGFLFLLGIVLFVYGVALHTVTIPDKDGLAVTTKSEPELIQQIADTCPT